MHILEAPYKVTKQIKQIETVKNNVVVCYSRYLHNKTFV